MHRAEKERSKMMSPAKFSDRTFAGKSPVLAKSPMANRLYLAPQSTVRRPDSPSVEKKRHGSQPSSGAPRRRRYKQGSNKNNESFRRVREHDHHGNPSLTNMFSCGDDCSDSSNDSYDYNILEAPLLWVDDGDDEACASPKGRTGQRHRRHKRRHHRDSGSVQSYGNNDEESVYTYFSNQSSRKAGRERPSRATKCQRACGKFLLKGDIFCSFRTRYRPIFQMLLFSTLIFLVWDARQGLSYHKAQLRHLEEEKEHILDQMSWIDNEAKKAHEHYSTPKLDAGDLQPSPLSIRARAELEHVQLRIQQNARDEIAERFGDAAMLVSLPLKIEGDPRSDVKLTIVLSGDAPHAASTFARQAMSEKSVWNKLSIQRLISESECSVVAIQANTENTNILPVLEFVEKTRGCHEAGAVSLHPLESPGEESQRLMLKVRLASSTTRRQSGDVCIGRIVEGLDELEAMLPSLPVFHVDEVLNY